VSTYEHAEPGPPEGRAAVTPARDTQVGLALIVRRDRLLRPGHLVPMLVDHLEAWGARVMLIDPDVEPVSLHDLHATDVDLYVLVSPSEAALSLAGALEGSGGVVFPSYTVAAGCRDKIVQTAVLSHAGLPVPESWLTVHPETLAGELRRGPLLVKDPRGSLGRGLHLVRHRDDLWHLSRGTPWLVMRYHRADGPDLKLYRIDDEVHGVARTFPAHSIADKLGRPLQVTSELRDLAVRCGDAFGTNMCGVDVIRSDGRLWVVDMSSFPGFKGVPDAADRIAHLVLTRARRQQLERAS
jgi:ribosomal protein S6--L-glutamate ligase